MDGIFPKLEDPIGGSCGISLPSKEFSSGDNVCQSARFVMTACGVRNAPTVFPTSRHWQNKLPFIIRIQQQQFVNTLKQTVLSQWYQHYFSLVCQNIHVDWILIGSDYILPIHTTVLLLPVLLSVLRVLFVPVTRSVIFVDPGWNRILLTSFKCIILLLYY